MGVEYGGTSVEEAGYVKVSTALKSKAVLLRVQYCGSSALWLSAPASRHQALRASGKDGALKNMLLALEMSPSRSLSID